MPQDYEILRKLRIEGHTLQAIGDKVGVTRERVRQILKEHYGSFKRGLLSEREVSEIIGCPVLRLEKLRESGVINPRHQSWFYLYDENETEKVMLALQRNCEHCGKPLPIRNLGKRCTECKVDYRRNPYPFKSDEGKRRALEAYIKWQKQHPEQVRETSRRANKKYWEKKRPEHYAKTRYLVVRGGVMPIGSIVRATGCHNWYFILENGLKIPVSHVRKMKTGEGNNARTTQSNSRVQGMLELSPH